MKALTKAIRRGREYAKASRDILALDAKGTRDREWRGERFLLELRESVTHERFVEAFELLSAEDCDQLSDALGEDSFVIDGL